MELIEQNKQDLPNATTVLTLGILSLIFCWCYGIVGLILGIIAVAMASAQRKIYHEHPELYTETSYKNVNAGKVCGIIAICLSSAVFVIAILAVLGLVALSIGAVSVGL